MESENIDYKRLAARDAFMIFRLSECSMGNQGAFCDCSVILPNFSENVWDIENVLRGSIVIELFFLFKQKFGN